jgi:hypothetical protein
MWNEKTLVTWDNEIAELQRMQETCSSAKFTWNGARAALEGAFIAAYSTWRTQSEILNRKAAALKAANIAWYAAATRIFTAGTAEGDMIRRSIPTFYSRPVPAEPSAPAAQPQPVAA